MNIIRLHVGFRSFWVVLVYFYVCGTLCKRFRTNFIYRLLCRHPLPGGWMTDLLRQYCSRLGAVPIGKFFAAYFIAWKMEFLFPASFVLDGCRPRPLSCLFLSRQGCLRMQDICPNFLEQHVLQIENRFFTLVWYILVSCLGGSDWRANL